MDSEVAEGRASPSKKVTTDDEPKKRTPLTIGDVMRVVDRKKAKAEKRCRPTAQPDVPAAAVGYVCGGCRHSQS